MRCQRCGKPISPLRQLSDREFCSEYCKKRGPRASASGLQDLEGDFAEGWNEAPRQNQRSAARSGASLGLVLVAVLGVMVTGRFWLGDPTAGAGKPLPGAVLDPQAPSASGADRPALERLTLWLQDRLPGEKPLSLRADLRQGLGPWRGGPGWRIENGLAHPGRLRLWDQTAGKRNYELEFVGQIERKAIGWAFRAGDEANYYSSKIVLHRPGEISGASIQRAVVQRAETVSRMELPLPVILQRNRPYQFTLTVDGNRFRTLIDGHVIDEWTDTRYKTGAVGFFSDEGEAAGLHWASFRERRPLFAGVLASAFFLPPGMSMMASDPGPAMLP